MPMSFFGRRGKEDELEQTVATGLGLPAEQRENLQHDVSLLEDEDGSRSQRLQKVAEREVRSAAEDSVRRMHVINLGRCPVCGDHLYQHMSASICEACGWHKYDTPRQGKVRVHLRNNSGEVVGGRAYLLKSGECLVMHNDVVIAKVPANAYDWVEYVWREEEIAQRRMQITGKLKVPCAWCGVETEPNKDGFHLVHVAFGSSQERYCFCSDECLEIFRKTYPSRVHRNCYERSCSDCNLCIKRYGDEADEIRTLVKDFIRQKRE
ncbi:MAG: hypothetical protein GX927_07125 [Lentisphaerae bacterium]|nr:hypothetical protein [Lentisphaerota bacterium]